MTYSDVRYCYYFFKEKPSGHVTGDGGPFRFSDGLRESS